MALESTTIGKILKYFYENPNEEIYLRELAKKLKISTFSVKKYLDGLVSENMVVEHRKGKMRIFKANTNNLPLRHLKIAYNLSQITKSGLIEHLKEKIPLLISIVIYGSVSRGEDTKGSDLDILIIGKNVQLNLSKYKKSLGREITLLIYKPSEWKNKARENRGFYQNVITDGIAVYGNLPLIE
jgi:predicted nucleotidyltransferase